MSEWVKNWELTIGILHFYAIFSYKHHSKQLNNTIFGYPDPKHACVKHVMHLWLEDVYDWVVTTKHQHIKWISHQNPTYILHMKILRTVSNQHFFLVLHMSYHVVDMSYCSICSSVLCKPVHRIITYSDIYPTSSARTPLKLLHTRLFRTKQGQVHP